MQEDRHIRTLGTEMDQETTDSEFVEMSDFDEEGGKGTGLAV
jgi:hypothetical protein